MTKNFDSLNDTFNTSMEDDNTSTIKPQELNPESMKPGDIKKDYEYT